MRCLPLRASRPTAATISVAPGMNRTAEALSSLRLRSEFSCGLKWDGSKVDYPRKPVFGGKIRPSGRQTFASLRKWWLGRSRSEEHTSELQSRLHLVCRLLLEKKKHMY